MSFNFSSNLSETTGDLNTDDIFKSNYSEQTVQDIAQLKQEIDNTETAIKNTQKEIEEKKKINQQKIEELKHHLAEAKRQNVEMLKEQEEKQTQERLLLQSQFDSDLKTFNDQFAQLNNDIIDLQEDEKQILLTTQENQLLEAQKKFELNQSKLTIKQYLQQENNEREVFLQNEKVQNLAYQVQQLESEIKDVKSKQNNLEFEILNSTNAICLQLQEQKKSHQHTISEIENQMKQRNKHNDDHIQNLKNMLELETSKMQHINATANQKYETVNNVYKSFSRNALIELQEKAKIINQLKDLIEESKEKRKVEQQQQQINVEKNENLKSKIMSNKQFLESLQKELQTIKTQNSLIKKQIISSQTSPKTKR